MYSNVYDITNEVFLDLGAVIFYIFFAILINIIISIGKKNNKNILLYKIINIVVFLICFFLTFYSWMQFSTLRSIAKKNEWQVIEGKVENLSRTSKSSEKFTIGGKLFEYDDVNKFNGYSKLSWKGGEIIDGRNVRIYYFEGKILKLEIRNN